VTFHQNIGLLVMRFSKTLEGHFCKSCIHKSFWEFTVINLSLGWWGLISLFVTPYFILGNIVEYISVLGMPPVPPRRGLDMCTTIQVSFHAAAVGGLHELQIRPDGEGGRIERLTIKIPAGIHSGTVLRLKGQGGRGAGGRDGDLDATVQVCDHPWFRRDGDNVLLDVPVTPAECELGAHIEVPTLVEGTVVLVVPAGSSNGSRLRLRGMGLKNDLTGSQGDQLVVVKIVESNEVDGKSPRDGLW
jgi:hypothetical protein